MSGKINVRAKGQRAERAVIDLLQPVVTRCYEAMGLEPPKLQRNTLQSDEGGFDIVGLDWLALEIKHQETLNINKWWEQTIKQAKRGTEPILIYKQNNVKFRVRLYARYSVHKSEAMMVSIVEISIEDFIEYFRERLMAELSQI